MTTQEILQNAVKAKPVLAAVDTGTKNRALQAMASAIAAHQEDILAANQLDLDAARGTVSDVMLDRLLLDEDRIAGMCRGILDILELPDPTGRILEERTIAANLSLRKISVPIGVIAIIYESRPNVTSDAAALTLKTGNVCILRSGREAYRTSRAIVTAMQKGLVSAGLPRECINIVDDTTRESANALMRARGYVDLLIPRGGAGLIRACVENATVPCIETGTGICHIYVDEEADLEKALNILDNAKTQRPSVCNACEVCLVHEAIAQEFLPLMKKRLTDDRASAGLIPVELRLDERASQIIPGTPAGPEDFDTEFLDFILAVKVVKSLEEAVDHIAVHSTHHSESIITEDPCASGAFTTLVDSACVYVNASTRFTDGGMFGLGCEMGISTQKLHARGPMGLKEMTCYRYVIEGSGQTR